MVLAIKIELSDNPDCTYIFYEGFASFAQCDVVCANTISLTWDTDETKSYGR